MLGLEDGCDMRIADIECLAQMKQEQMPMG